MITVQNFSENQIKDIYLNIASFNLNHVLFNITTNIFVKTNCYFKDSNRFLNIYIYNVHKNGIIFVRFL